MISMWKASDAAHASFPFDPDPTFRIFNTCSSALQQSCCYRREIQLQCKQEPEGIVPWQL
jgi:hypothetical protein